MQDGPLLQVLLKVTGKASVQDLSMLSKKSLQPDVDGIQVGRIRGRGRMEGSREGSTRGMGGRREGGREAGRGEGGVWEGGNEVRRGEGEGRR